MMQRIRIRGKSIGQIDEEIIKLYGKVESYNKLTIMLESIISREILSYTVETIEYLDIAENYVRNLHYRNIGEYLEDYMRQKVWAYLEICANCDFYFNGVCSIGDVPVPVHEWEKACDEVKMSVKK